MAEARGEVRCDEKGRIVLPKEARDRYGERFLLVQGSDGIWLIPQSGDPLRRLAELGRNLPDIPVSELRKQALKDAEDMVARKVERVRRR